MKTVASIKREIGCLCEELRGGVTPARKGAIKKRIEYLNQMILYIELKTNIYTLKQQLRTLKMLMVD